MPQLELIAFRHRQLVLERKPTSQSRLTRIEGVAYLADDANARLRLSRRELTVSTRIRKGQDDE